MYAQLFIAFYLFFGALAVVHHPPYFVTLTLTDTGQRLLYRLGSGLVLVLVLRFCAYSYGGVYNRNTAGGELQQERPFFMSK